MFDFIHHLAYMSYEFSTKLDTHTMSHTKVGNLFSLIVVVLRGTNNTKTSYTVQYKLSRILGH